MSIYTILNGTFIPLPKKIGIVIYSLMKAKITIPYTIIPFIYTLYIIYIYIYIEIQQGTR